MKSKIKIILEMLEKLFNGEYDPEQFSYNIEDFICDNYEDLEKENNEIATYLNDDVVDIVEVAEPNFDATEMINKLRISYEKINSMLNK